MRLSFVASGVGALLVGSLFGGAAGFANAQTTGPTIATYQIERVERDGRDFLVFTWDVRNVDRVTLLRDGREIPARFQLDDGSLGWPPKMQGAFSTMNVVSVYTLVAENPSGRVEARGMYYRRVCYSWLVPPATRWSRCRRGGVVAANLSTTGAAAKPQCTVEGRVTSRLNFVARLPNDTSNPAAGTTTYRLDTVLLRRVGSGAGHWLRLAGRGNNRRYQASGLEHGRSYVVRLPWRWRGIPHEIRFSCSSTTGEYRIVLGTIENTDFLGGR